MFPEASIATPPTPLKSAEAAGPSVLPLLPGVPATVVTTPVDVTLRIVKLEESET